VQPSTVHCIKETYLNEIKKMRLTGNMEPLPSFLRRRRGRPLLLGEKIDTMVQAYIRRICETGGGVSSELVIGAATDCLDKTGSQEQGNM